MNIKKLKAIEDLLKEKKSTTPDKGYFPRTYWQKELKVSEKTASVKIKEMIEFGLMTVKTFKVRTGQVVRPVPHYKLISK